MIREDYKDIRCIAEMTDQYQKSFDLMVNEYAKKLSDKLIENNSVYTLHDFNHHCFNIYKIISEVLFSEIAFDKKRGLDSRELYILNLAVLFHDIGMNSLDMSRDNHSKLSADYVQELYDTQEFFKKNSLLTLQEIKALKEIIIAHSDIKDGSVPEQYNGLKSPNLTIECKLDSGADKYLRTLFLAAVLRIADELDVSCRRLGEADLERELRKIEEKVYSNKSGNDFDTKGKDFDYLNSLKHWKRLHYISDVKREENNIVLQIDDEEIRKEMDASQSILSLAQEIMNIVVKIRDEIKMANKIVFSTKDFHQMVYIQDISFNTNNNELEKKTHEAIDYRKTAIVNSLEKPSENIKETLTEIIKEKDNKNDEIASLEKRKLDSLDVLKENKNKLEETGPKVLDEKIEEELSKEVIQRGLIQFGHYILNNDYCARDWIDTRELIETKKILSKIVGVIVKNLNGLEEESVIIGVDLIGALVAARVSFTLQNPLTYVVSSKNEGLNADMEVEISPRLLENKIPVLITDVIVSYETIKKIIEKYKINTEKILIVTVFYRPSKEYGSESNFIEKTVSLNNKYPIELYNKLDCRYNKKGGCFAKNRTLNQKDEKSEEMMD